MYVYEFEVELKTKKEIPHEKRMELLGIIRKELQGIIPDTDATSLRVQYHPSLDDIMNSIKNPSDDH